MNTGTTFIAETVKGYGITHVFFVEAILRRSLIEMEFLGIKRVLTHSEKAAAYMADGYARAGRKPGICMAQSVGAANLASGLQEPFLAGSPVIALTGRKHAMAQHRNAYQEVLHAPMFKPITKFSVTIENPTQLPLLLRQAFREATSGSPGPVHLDLMGHQGQIVETAIMDDEVIVEKSYAHCPAIRIEPEPEKLPAVASTLLRAKRPVIVVGGGAAISDAGPFVTKLAEALSLPVAASPNGKGLMADDHPLYMGIVGRYSCPCANQIVSEADLVLYIGSNTGDMVTNGWSIPKPKTQVIQIDINPSELGRNYPNRESVLGDARTTLVRLMESGLETRSQTQWSDHAQSVRAGWLERIQAGRHSMAVPIRVERLCEELTHALPHNAVLVSDTGNSAIWTTTMVFLKYPQQQRYIRCSGTLGWGFPASLGVKCALPEQPVVCFTGDGGFWYHLAELETARRLNIPTVTVVNNNSGLGQCKSPVNRLYGEKTGKSEEMWGFSPVDFAKIAESMGCLGFRVERPEKISEALSAALASNQPAVVDVVTDINCESQDVWGGEQPV